MRVSSRAVLAASVVLAAGLAGYLVLAPGANRPADSGEMARGAALYRQHCASCHGVGLEGQPDWRSRLPTGRLPAPPHDESGHTWHHPDRVLFEITKRGLAPFAPPGYESDMPAYGETLGDAEIRAVLNFIKRSWPDAIRSRQAEIDRRSRENR